MTPLLRSRVTDAAVYAGDWLEYLQRSLRIPGLAVAVRHEDELLLSRAFGFADVERGEEMRTDHVFRIASHSKTFTATAIMLLAERDILSLDDRLSRWLDWLEDEPGGAGRLRVRHLLSHSAGVIRDGLDAGWWDLRMPFHDAASLQAAVRADPPVYSASERFKYSNIGYSLLGAVIEAASGQSYNDFVRSEIVDRLGLRSTGPEPDDTVADRLATGYSSRRYGQRRLPFPALDTRAMSAATGFYSTAEDLCRYGAAHFLGNEELLTDETKREMQHEAWKVEGPQTRHYALGFNVAEVGGRRLIGHGGGFPGFITYTCIDPVDQLVVSVLTNAIDGPAEALATGVVELINRANKTATTPAPEELPADVDLSRFTGRFFSLWGAIDIVKLGDELVALTPDLLPPTLDVIELEVVDDRTLRIAKAAGYSSPGERVAFEFDEGGRISQVQFAGSRFLPLADYETRLKSLSPGGAPPAAG
jgi:CubicO group peptidase (beta-lactamase class C family)